MDYTKLATVLRERAEALDLLAAEERLDAPPPDRETLELLRVLARMVEGQTIDRAFGAPGDWGYSTPIGKALRAAYGC